MSENKVPDFIFMGDLMQFEGHREYPVGDNRAGFEFQDMTVFIRRNEVRAVLAADYGGIVIIDSAWREYDAMLPDNVEYGDLYNRIIAWRTGTTPT